jgi:hypothetical protein
VSTTDHSTEWYADTEATGVTYVHRTSDNKVVGWYERDWAEPDNSFYLPSFRVVVCSPTVIGDALITTARDPLAVLRTILSRWGMI